MTMIHDPLPDLTQIACFLSVAQHRSFSAAARDLNLTQPAVTQKIKRLEQTLDTALIDRTSRPLLLTQAGQVLLRHAPALLVAARKLKADIAGLEVGTRAILRLGMPDSLSEIMGAEIVGAAQSLAQQVELKSGISPWLETAFHQRHFDLAIDSPPFSAGGDVTQSLLFQDPFVLALPPRLADVPLEQVFTDESLVGYGRNSKFGADCLAISNRLGIRNAPRFSFDSTQSLLRFVQAGYGWAITSAFCLFQSPRALETITILPCPESTPRSFYLLHRTGEIDEVAGAVRQRFRQVFMGLTQGPWHRMAPRTAAMIAGANRDYSSRP